MAALATMEELMDKKPTRRAVSRRTVLAAGVGSAGVLAMPWVAGAQAKAFRIGMQATLSGSIAQAGITHRNSVQMEVERINAAGGLAGRPIEVVYRDSKGQPQEAAHTARELINTEGCDMLLDAEASSGSFAVQEVVRDLGVLCIHTSSETSSLTADPKYRVPTAFRAARQGVHDSIVGAAYAAQVATAKKLTKWGTCAPDYAFGRDTTAQYLEFLKHFKPDIEVIVQAWPKLGQSDFTEVITKLIQAKPQAMYTCLYAGDLSAFVNQGIIYALFSAMQVFAVNMADYTTLTAVKNLPPGIHSGNRYVMTCPDTQANRDWAEAYRKRYNEYPTNWSWESATGMMYLEGAAKKAGSSDPMKLAEALRGLKIACPFGVDGTVTMRAEDQTSIGYAIGWGTTLSQAPYVSGVKAADWGVILEMEQEWKKRNGFI
jgi:branched-chain amino acid transport system substrate-binding protein